MHGAKSPFTQTVLRWCLVKNNKMFLFICSSCMSPFYSSSLLWVLFSVIFPLFHFTPPLTSFSPYSSSTSFYPSVCFSCQYFDPHSCTSATERFRVLHWPETQTCTFQSRDLWHSRNAALAVTYIGSRQLGRLKPTFGLKQRCASNRQNVSLTLRHVCVF